MIPIPERRLPIRLSNIFARLEYSVRNPFGRQATHRPGSLPPVWTGRSSLLRFPPQLRRPLTPSMNNCRILLTTNPVQFGDTLPNILVPTLNLIEDNTLPRLVESHKLRPVLFTVKNTLQTP